MSVNPQIFSVDPKRTSLFTHQAWQLSIRDLGGILPRRPTPAAAKGVVLNVDLAWSFEQHTPKTEERLVLHPQACRFGGVRWWFSCPHCRKRAYALYGHNGCLACRQCQGLRYISRTWSKPMKLMHFYSALREGLERRPGPKPARYWRHLEREDRYTRIVLEGLRQYGKKLNRSAQ